MQGILGTSLNNPIFYITRSSDDGEGNLSIFYGFEKLATVPDDKNSILFRSIIAMLVNAGVRKRHIQQNFNVSFETVQKTAKVFETATNDEELTKRLKLPGRPEKVTNEISDFIYTQVAFHKSKGERHHIKKTIDSVWEQHNIKISRETIRRCLVEKKSIKKPEADKNSADAIHTKPLQLSQIEVLPPIPRLPQTFRNQYAGLLLLSAQLSLVFNDFPETRIQDSQYPLKAIFIWWILGVLSSAKNLEQLRYLNVKDFEFISGFVGLPSVETMRKILYDLSLLDDAKFSTLILKKNIDYFVEHDNSYYLDGHFEQYTGTANVTRGWSTIKNRVCKGTFDTFVHDGAGNPIFSLLSDNFYDFREIIPMLLERIKTLRPNKPVTLIYDRGAFSTDLMKLIAEKEHQYFITWQKGFQQKEAQQIKFDQTIFIEYPYNDLGIVKTIKYNFGEDVWHCNNFSCRRIVFKKHDNDFHQSILTNAAEMDAGLVVKKMIGRSLQENDFKKQKSHFGLDEITSYRKLDYGALNDKDGNKKTNNPQYQKMLRDIRLLKDQRNRLIQKVGLKLYRAYQQENISAHLLDKNKKIFDNIDKINARVQKLKDEKNLMQKQMSKLELFKKGNNREIDLRSKRILGLLKVTSRNIFENAAKDFLETYGNLRDYQKVFRKLTRIGGEITIDGDVMIVKLDSFGRPAFKARCNKYFEKINNRQLTTMNGTLTLQFALLD